MFKVKLHPFYNLDGAIGDASPSVEGTVETVSAESASVQETPEQETTESESSFAKRLREHSEKAIKAEREKWEKETSEKYKDYDTHKELSSYFQQINGLDAMTLKERIEMEKLQEKAEANNISPEMQKRLEYLEQRDQKAQELEQQQQQIQQYQEFRTNLEKFATEKGANADELHAFMHEKGIGNMEVAFDAMEAVKLREQLQDAEKNGMKKLLQAKGSIPTVNGKAAQGQVVTAAPKTFAEARARAMQRMSQE